MCLGTTRLITSEEVARRDRRVYFSAATMPVGVMWCGTWDTQASTTRRWPYHEVMMRSPTEGDTFRSPTERDTVHYLSSCVTLPACGERQQRKKQRNTSTKWQDARLHTQEYQQHCQRCRIVPCRLNITPRSTRAAQRSSERGFSVIEMLKCSLTAGNNPTSPVRSSVPLHHSSLANSIATILSPSLNPNSLSSAAS